MGGTAGQVKSEEKNKLKKKISQDGDKANSELNESAKDWKRQKLLN